MYKLRNVSYKDYEFIYQLNKIVNKDFIEKVWGVWCEDYQRKFFKGRFNLKTMKVIMIDDKDAGMVVYEQRKDHLYLNEIQILPQYQGRGIGTAIMRRIIHEAESKGLNVKLKVLKINPARRLYERLGFKMAGETETHYIMVLPINKSVVI